jgi:hypothetical protein
LSRRDASKVEEHLGQCARCAGLYDELSEVNGNLRGLLAPLLLGSAAAAYISAGGLAGATGAVLTTLSKVGALVATPTQAVAAGGVAAATTAVAVVGFNTMQAPEATAESAAAETQSQASGKDSAGRGSKKGDFVGALPGLGGSEALIEGGELFGPSGAPRVREPASGRRDGPAAAAPTAQATPTGEPSTTPTGTPSGTPTDSPSTPSTTTTTPPTTTTAPPPPPPGTTADLSVTGTTASASDPPATIVTFMVGLSSALAATDTLTLSLHFPPDAAVTPAGWSCSDPAGGAMSCTAPADPAPAPLTVTVVPTGAGTLTASISGPATNTDPASDNDSYSVELTAAALTEPSATAETPTE